MKTIIGKSGNGKYNWNGSHPVNSSARFGYFQPASNVIECTAGDSFEVRFGQFVRLMPLNLPTAGQASLRTIAGFVNTEDIWHPWASFQAGKSYYSSGVGNYIPTKVPFINDAHVTALMLSYSNVTVYSLGGALSDDAQVEWDDATLANQTQTNTALNQFFPDWFDRSKATISNTLPVYGHVTGASADMGYHIEYNNDHFLILFRLKNSGNELYKVLRACGIIPNFDLDPSNILPLVAYYKVYFDRMVPKNNMTWKQTNAFGLMEYLEQYNVTDIKNNATARDKFKMFFADLICPYYFNADFVGAHIIGTANNSIDNVIFGLGARGASDSIVVDAYNNPGSTAYSYVSNQSPLTYVKMKAVEILTHMANKDTAIGGNIREYMYAHGLGQYLDDHVSMNIGAQSTPIEISEIMSTTAYQSDDVDQMLGEYAGQGRAMKAVKDARPMHVKTKNAGYFVSMMAIIPESTYCQQKFGTVRHLERNDFWHAEFEGLTLKPTHQNEIFAEENFGSSNFDYQSRGDQSFGNIPIYSEYKHQPALLNGNLARRSYRSSLLPYTLDRFITPPGIPDDVDPTVSAGFSAMPRFSAGNSWRTITYKSLGNFDRIFQTYDQTYLSDMDEENFIIHEYVQIQGTTHRLPMSMSFDTEAFARDAFDVEKA